MVGAAGVGGGVDGFDDGAADALATGFGAGEEILEIAARTSGPCHRVKEVVDDAEQLAVERRGAEAEYGGFRVHKARPGEVGNVSRDAGFIENEIALPELLPVRAVGGGEGADSIAHDAM